MAQSEKINGLTTKAVSNISQSDLDVTLKTIERMSSEPETYQTVASSFDQFQRLRYHLKRIIEIPNINKRRHRKRVKVERIEAAETCGLVQEQKQEHAKWEKMYRQVNSHLRLRGDNKVIDALPEAKDDQLVVTSPKSNTSSVQETSSLAPILSKAKLKQPPNPNASKTCYICKQFKNKTHAFYASMCQPCGELNYAKRIARLPNEIGRGKVIVVTGGRVKIGYQVALRLLESGFTVVVTTRFVDDCNKRFATHADYAAWTHDKRLYIVELDLCFEQNIARFVDFLQSTFSHIDGLIQNAAQTDRKPPAFYRSLVGDSQNNLEPNTHGLLTDTTTATATATATTTATATATATSLVPIKLAPIPSEANHLISSTQLACLVPKIQSDHMDALTEAKYFPPNQIDSDGQQVDLRPKVSWNQTLEQTAPYELAETMMVNQLAPTLLLQKLTPLLHNDSKSERLSFVIHVSAVEGIFHTQHKRAGTHVMNNMAKAAMNMFTHTVGADMLKHHNILVNSVDTGWNTIMQPEYRATVNPPLDCADGAARIVDPMFTAYTELLSKKRISLLECLAPGLLYKDYCIARF